MSLSFWFNVAAYLTWAVCGVPVMRGVVDGRFSTGEAAAAGLAFVTFGAAFTLLYREWIQRSLTARRFLLGAMSIAAVMLVWITRDGVAAALLVVTAAGVPYAFPPAAVAAWIAAQSVALVGIFWFTAGGVPALVSGGAFVGFQLFAVSAAALALNESRAVQALARANAELTATRELLAENSRIAERLRIARDLHDALGHHLTALSIQLDVASRISNGAAADHIREAHALARLLLSDVRHTVSTLRGSSRIDLAQALRALAAAPGPLAIHLDLPDRLELADGSQAHALLRCVQEVITNTARHASAQNLWIAVAQRADGIHLHARDDGRGSSDVRWGNGLRGMRERFEEYAGRIDFTSAAGKGFEVHGIMPPPEAA